MIESSLMKYNINRRDFLGLFGCGCCGFILPSYPTVPVTERKQLTIIPESTVNRQAMAAYEQFKSKAKLVTKGKELEKIITIGKKIEKSVSNFFLKKDGVDPTTNFGWDYILVNNDKIKKRMVHARW